MDTRLRTLERSAGDPRPLVVERIRAGHLAAHVLPCLEALGFFKNAVSCSYGAVDTLLQHYPEGATYVLAAVLELAEEARNLGRPTRMAYTLATLRPGFRAVAVDAVLTDYAEALRGPLARERNLPPEQVGWLGEIRLAHASLSGRICRHGRFGRHPLSKNRNEEPCRDCLTILEPLEFRHLVHYVESWPTPSNYVLRDLAQNVHPAEKFRAWLGTVATRKAYGYGAAKDAARVLLENPAVQEELRMGYATAGALVQSMVSVQHLTPIIFGRMARARLGELLVTTLIRPPVNGSLA